MTTLSYSVTEPALRSPVEEWQPHGKQSESTTEWWYLTAVVHDTAGNPYFLVWCAFHFTGEKASPASAGLPRYDHLVVCLVSHLFAQKFTLLHARGHRTPLCSVSSRWPDL